MDLLRTRNRLYRLRSLRNLRSPCWGAALCIRRVVGIGLCAGATVHSRSVSLDRITTRASWMEASVNKKEEMNADVDDIPMVYLLYVVLGIVVLVAGALGVSIRMFLAL